VRLLFTIPHFFDPGGDPWHGASPRDPVPRISALTRAVTALHGHFGRRQYLLDVEHRTVLRANQASVHDVDVVVCTTRGLHLLDDLELPSSAYDHRPGHVDPALLGFECHSVLKEALGDYDYYCYLEQDIVIHDPWFFAKLEWFNGWAPNEALLMPNRFELDAEGGGRKTYVDPRIPADETRRFQDTGDQPVLARNALGRRLLFHRPSNPHAACFFLTAEQMHRWVATPHFLDRDTGFVGAPESAATLGMMRTFNVYKPAPGCAAFFELEHADPRFASVIETRTALDPG
jgi:hypothetical protein